MGTTASSGASPSSAEGSSSDGAGVVLPPIIPANGAVAVDSAVDGSDRKAADGDDCAGGAADGSDADPKDEDEDEDENEHEDSNGGGVLFSMPVLSKIATFAEPGDGTYELLLPEKPDEREDYKRGYFFQNFAVLESAVLLSGSPESRDEGHRRLSTWIEWNQTLVRQYQAKASVENALLPLYSYIRGGNEENVFNPIAVFRNPVVAASLESPVLLERSLVLSPLGVNGTYSFDLHGSDDETDDGSLQSPCELILWTFVIYRPMCLEYLLGRVDVDLLASTKGSDSLNELTILAMRSDVSYYWPPTAEVRMEFMALLLTHPKFCEATATLLARNEPGPLQFAVGRLGNPDRLVDLNRGIAVVVMLVEIGADIDAASWTWLSPLEIALRDAASEDVTTATRSSLALAALRGQLDLDDCCGGLDALSKTISWLLFLRLGALVGPTIFAHHVFRKLCRQTLVALPWLEFVCLYGLCLVYILS